MAAGYSVTLTAVDNATKSIDAINKRLQAIHAPTERLNAAMQKFSRLSGLSDLAKGMGNLARGALDAFRSISQIIAPLGAITGAASLAGMYRLTASWASWGQQLGFTAQRIGIATPRLQELENVATLAGSSAGAMDEGLKGLRDTLTNFAGGHPASGLQAAMLNMFGVDGKRAAQLAADPAKAMEFFAQKLKAIRDPTLRAAAAEAVFGGNVQALAPYLNLTSEQLARYTQEVRAHGTMTEEQFHKAELLAHANAGLQLSVEGLGNSVAASVSGPLTDLASFMSALIDRNREVIAAKFGEWAVQFSEWVKKINWTAVANDAEGVGRAVINVATALAKAVEWTEKMGITSEVLGGILVLKLLGPLTGIAAKLAYLGAFELPGWIAALLGVSTAAVAVGAGVVAGAGVAAAVGSAYETPETRAAQENLARQRRFDPMASPSDGYGDGSGAVTPTGPRGSGMFNSVEQQNRLPAGLLWNVYGAESSFGANTSTSSAGAEGPFQFMPKTGADLGLNTPQDRQDLNKSANAAGQYLHRLMNMFGGDVEKAVAGYNWGEGNLQKDIAAHGADWKLYLPKETSDYINRTTHGALAGTVPLGAPLVAPSAPAGRPGDTPAPSGTATITVRHENPPAGATVTASTTGNVFSGAPRIESGLPQTASP